MEIQLADPSSYIVKSSGFKVILYEMVAIYLIWLYDDATVSIGAFTYYRMVFGEGVTILLHKVIFNNLPDFKHDYEGRRARV